MGKSANAMRGGIVSAIQELNAKVGNTRPLVTSMSQAMQDSAQFSFGAAQGIRAVANNIEMMVQQMTYLKSTGMSTGEIFKSMVATIKGPIGVLVAVSAFSAGLQWLTTYLQQSSKAAKEAKAEIKDLGFELNDILYKLGLISGGSGSMITGRQVQIAGIDTKIAQLRRPVPLISSAREARTYRGPAGDLVNIPAKAAVEDTATIIKNETEVAALLIERAKLMADIDGFQKDATKEQEKQTKELEKQQKLVEAMYEKSYKMMHEQIKYGRSDEDIVNAVPGLKKNAEFMRAYGNTPGFLRRFQNAQEDKGALAEGMRGIKGVREMSGGWNVDKIVKGWDDAEKKVNIFGDTMKGAFREATNVLADGFIKAFGLGDNLVGRLAGTFLSAMAQMAANWIATQVAGTAATVATTTVAAGALTAAWMPAATLASIATLGTAAVTGSAAVATALAGASIAGAGAGVGIAGAGAVGAGVTAVTARASGGWINEPVVGMGLQSRSIYTIAERGPEYVSPASSNRMGQQGRGGGMMQPYVTVVPIVNNAGLAVQVEIGKTTNGRMRL
jgi:hypothetical protein